MINDGGYVRIVFNWSFLFRSISNRLAFTITWIIAPICIVTKHLVKWNFFSILNKIQTVWKFICILYNEFSAEIFKFVTFCKRFQDHSLSSGNFHPQKQNVGENLHENMDWIWLSSIIIFMKNCFWRRTDWADTGHENWRKRGDFAFKYQRRAKKADTIMKCVNTKYELKFALPETQLRHYFPENEFTQEGWSNQKTISFLWMASADLGLQTMNTLNHFRPWIIGMMGNFTSERKLSSV